MKNIRFFLSENFQFLEVKFSIHLNRRVFVMSFQDDLKLAAKYEYRLGMCIKVKDH